MSLNVTTPPVTSPSAFLVGPALQSMGTPQPWGLRTRNSLLITSSPSIAAR